MADLKKKVEALLFSSGKRMKVVDISRLCKTNEEDVKQALNELKSDYGEKNSSLMLIDEGDFWKLTVREQYLSIVQKIVTETELSKTILETLAVIAFRYPIKQSDLIKIRTNKSYDHLSELEEAGYISRQKHGRSKLIKLTDKFFEYFDLPRDKLRDQFKDFQGIAKAIEEKEDEVHKIKEDQRRQAEEAKKEDEKIRQAAETVDKEKILLETYESGEKEKMTHVEVIKEKLGNLEVVDEPSEEELEKERKRIQKIQEEDEEKIEEKKEEGEGKKTEQKKKSAGIQLTDEMEKEVDRKVEEMLHPPEETQEEEKEKSETEKEEESKDLLEAAREEEDKENKN